MLIRFDPTGSPEELKRHLAEFDEDERIQGIVVLAGIENGFTPENLNGLLARVSKPLVGGVFPNIIYQATASEKGTIIWGVGRPMEVAVLNGLSDAAVDIEETLEPLLGDPPQEPKLQLVLVDGFSSRISAFLSALHDFTGPTMESIGGGAGSLDMVQRPCLISNQGLLKDAALVARFGTSAGVGVAHGWSRVAGPFRITAAQDTILKSLDWEPGFEVYRTVVEEHSGQSFGDTSFFDLAKAYPFGLARLDAEYIVRDPLMLNDDGSLTCVGEVSEGEHVDILHGDRETLLSAAQTAREQADQQLNVEPGLRLFMDCISRVLFLGDEFEEELRRVAVDDLPVMGACTFGEIANGGGEFLEFYNKTSVVATLSELRKES
ncbi:FIST signal transduction protein [Congregibacter litoralis]|uniref:Histidine kinase n=1 Tax=Congregibacter litoralis KT71 TaxID=314285 RepID=A4A9S7_9GAMM|nr:FIST C-terminal domain-containing protein [Congregibacter litoralis]EAQ97244.1 hypothetical protein KT71_07689 [Congregibacter litoralis KT71]